MWVLFDNEYRSYCSATSLFLHFVTGTGSVTYEHEKFINYKEKVKNVVNKRNIFLNFKNQF